MRYRYFTNDRILKVAPIFAALFLAQGIGAAPVAPAEAAGWHEAPSATHARMDARRNRLWILDRNSVYLYDAATRRLIGRVELPERSVAAEGCAPELALTRSGAALVTSNVIPTIWEIDPKGLAVRLHRLCLDADNDKDVGFTGLAFGADGNGLLGVSSLLGSVWTIDLVKDTAHKVPLSKPVHGACRMHFRETHGLEGGGATPVLCISGPRNARRVEFASQMQYGRTIPAPCSG